MTHLTSNGRTVEREEFLADILTTAVEGGINYWADVVEYHWNDLPSEDITATIVFEDPYKDGDRRYTLNTNDIQAGIDAIKAFDYQPNYFGDGGSYWRQFLLADETLFEDGDYDAIVADWIVQAGIFGEIVFG